MEEYIKFLEDLEQFEADMILCNEAWEYEDGLPKFTRELYDRWVELQEKRNKLLKRDLGKAKTYDELMM